jgi:hypothetical protein
MAFSMSKYLMKQTRCTLKLDQGKRIISYQIIGAIPKSMHIKTIPKEWPHDALHFKFDSKETPWVLIKATESNLKRKPTQLQMLHADTFIYELSRDGAKLKSISKSF